MILRNGEERRERERKFKMTHPRQSEGTPDHLWPRGISPEKTPTEVPIATGHQKFQKCEKRGIMEILTGDHNVSQSGFGQNSFSIARGCASVPFNARRISFFGD